MPWYRADHGAKEFRLLTEPRYQAPSTGSKRGIAVIGDSTIFQSGFGPANLRRQLELIGYDPAYIYIYAVSGKPQWVADSAGRTVADNIAEARAYFATRGGEPDWLINLGANNVGSTDSTNSYQLNLLLNSLGQYSSRVLFTGLSQADSFDATNRNRYNRLSRTMVDRRPNMEWYDWHREVKGYNDTTGYWNADGVHNTSLGYAVKNAWLARIVGRPADLPSLSARLEGAGSVRYEDMYRAGNTLQDVVLRVNSEAPGSVLTFPEDKFTYSGFQHGGANNSVRMGTSTTPACRGFAGSGPNTIFEIIEGSSTKVIPAGEHSFATQLHIWGQRHALFQNFTIRGTEQGHNYHGLRFSYCYSPTVRGVTMIAPNVGDLNEPPGETFGVNFAWSDNGAIFDSTWDGRRNGDGSLRVGTSPFGWNTSMNAYVRRFYAHHSKAGMPTFWETTNIHTVDLRSEYMGSSSGKLNGQGVNHEKFGGVVRHIRPELVIDYAFGKPDMNTGLHMSFNNSTGVPGSPSFGDASDIEIHDVKHDRGPGGGFAVQTSARYHVIDGESTQTQTSAPVVTKAGVTLTLRDSPAGNINPDTEYARFK